MSKKNSKKKTSKKNKKNLVGKTNRTYKDTIFADLFSNDLDAEDNVISLVNALYGSNLKKGQVKYKKEKLESVLRVTDLKNDVSFMLDDKLLVLFEHQSTVNENMPIRCLLYCAEFYKRLLPENEYFNRTKQELPMPQFFVFYNGNDNYEKDCILKLSDSFMVAEGKELPEQIIKKSGSYMELTIRMININHEKNHELLKNCEIIRQYSKFTELMKEKGLRFARKGETCREKNQREKENLEKIKEVVDYCKANNILKDYFTRKGGEVYAMLKMQYSKEYEIECTKRYIKNILAEKERERKEKERERKEKYCSLLNVDILLIKNDKNKDEIKLYAGCTLPYLDEIIELVHENPDITVDELYTRIIEGKDNNQVNDDISTQDKQEG